LVAIQNECSRLARRRPGTDASAPDLAKLHSHVTEGIDPSVFDFEVAAPVGSVCGGRAVCDGQHPNPERYRKGPNGAASWTLPLTDNSRD
jgi:hypothetical protein